MKPDVDDQRCPWNGYTAAAMLAVQEGDRDVKSFRCTLAVGHVGHHVNEYGVPIPTKDVLAP